MTHNDIRPAAAPDLKDEGATEDHHPGGEERGEQWSHSEHGEQAEISQARRQPGGVQRSTRVGPGDDRAEQPPA